jgi:hypothetical protein
MAHFVHSPAELQLLGTTVPRIRSPGLTATRVLWESLPEMQQCSLSMAHLPGISLKSSTGCKISPPSAEVQMALKKAMSWSATFVGNAGTYQSVVSVDPGSNES